MERIEQIINEIKDLSEKRFQESREQIVRDYKADEGTFRESS